MTAGNGTPESAESGADVVLAEQPDQDGRRVCELRLGVSGPPAEAHRALAQVQRYALGSTGLVLPTLVATSNELRLVYLVGGTVLDEMIAGGPTKPHRVADLMVQLASALGFLHDQGIAHGHVRSELVWVGDRLSVGGLGVAQVAQAVGGARDAGVALPGRYRAPELRGRVPGRAETWSDIFAVGVLAAELLAGRRATTGVPAIGVSPAVDRLVEQATADSPSARPRSVQDWARLLADELDKIPLDVAESPVDVAEPAEPRGLASSSRAADLPRPSFAPPLVKDGSELLPPSGRRSFRDHRPALEELSHHPEAPPPPPRSRISAAPAQPGRGGFGIALLVIGGLLVMLAGVTVTFVLALQSGGRKAGVAISSAGSGQGGAGNHGPNPPHAPSSPPSPAPPSARAPVPSVPAPALADRGSAKTPPVHRRAPIPIDATTPVLGSPLAPATVVVFGDLAGFRSLKLLHRLRQLVLEHGSELRLAWRHQPQGDLPTAAVRTGVGVQLDLGSNAFWVFAEALAGQPDPNEQTVLRQALRRAGGTDGSLERWGRAPEVVNQLEADRALAVLFNVRSAPTVFLNGIRLEGTRLGELERVIEAERRAGVALIADGVAAEEVYPVRVLKNLVGVGKDLPERRCPSLRDAPTRGSRRPLVTIVEFGDFECEFCARALPVVDRLINTAPRDVRHVWKDFPLRQHRHARAAAALGRAAFQAGGNDAFWRIHKELFATSQPLEESELARVARAAGLDEGAAISAVRDGVHDAALEAQLEEAAKLGVRGIPTFFVNGIRVDGAASTELVRIVAQERERAARLRAAGVEPDRVYEALCGMR